MTAQGRRSEPLANVDAAWLRMEEPTNLMMVTGVWLFDTPMDFERLKVTLQHRLLRFDRFRQRVVPAKTLRGSPSWEVDRYFDISAHVHRIALPSPGDQQALQALVSDLMSTPLDFSKPLWQFHLIEQYQGGCALLARIHHAIADGIALVHVMLTMTDREADAPWASAAPEGEQQRQAGDGLGALFGPAASAVNATLRATETLLHEGMETLVHPERVLDLAKLGAGSAAALGKLVLMGPDPKTVFKGKLGVAKRAAWSRTIPLEAVKAIGRVAGGTVNDVLLTAVAGALRRYLLQRGESVADLHFRAVVPVNLRPLDSVPELGNRFGLVFLALPVGIADARERLVELKQRMEAIKGSQEAIVAFGILNAIGMAPAEIEDLVLKIFGSKATAVMTNVPGPREQLYFAGEQVRHVMFWVPQSGRLGLGVSILSYAGEVMLGVATDAGLVPDPEVIVAGFAEEFAEMMQLIPHDESLPVVEPMPEPEPAHVERCQGRTKAGAACKNRALANTGFCRVHANAKTLR